MSVPSDGVAAFTIRSFCKAYCVGRTFVYSEITAGRLTAHKAGNRTLILRNDAARWEASLKPLGIGSRTPGASGTSWDARADCITKGGIDNGPA